MQWHIHDDLCFTRAIPEAPQVGGAHRRRRHVHRRRSSSSPQSPMIHVWIVPHECGPFAALEGVGAGQIAAGEEHLCDHAHGSTTD